MASCSLFNFLDKVVFTRHPSYLKCNPSKHLQTQFIFPHKSITMLPKNVVRSNGYCLSHCLTVCLYFPAIAVCFCFLFYACISSPIGADFFHFCIAFLPMICFSSSRIFFSWLKLLDIKAIEAILMIFISDFQIVSSSSKPCSFCL